MKLSLWKIYEPKSRSCRMSKIVCYYKIKLLIEREYTEYHNLSKSFWSCSGHTRIQIW